MPYKWSPPLSQPASERHLSLWPYRSLRRRDFVGFIAVTATLMALPLLALVGSQVLWALLVPLALALWGTWAALQISYRRGEVLEDLTLTHDTVRLTRHNPNRTRQDWAANRHWVTVQIYSSGGPVEDYLTLRGNAREVEIGAFLDAAERLALYDELQSALARV